MKIVHAIQSLDPAAGGPPRVAAAIAAAQAAEGHEVSLASIDSPLASEEIAGLLRDTPGAEGVSVVTLPGPAGRWDRLTARQIKPMLTELVRDADAVHMHGVWEPLLLQAARLARRFGVPYAVRPAGMLDPWSLSQKRWKKKLALGLGVRRMLDGAAFLHALNRDEAELVGPLRLGCDVEVIPNGVFPQDYETPTEPGGFHRAHPELEGRRFVLFMSRLHYKKGLDILATAFAQVAAEHPEVVLVVAGPDGGARVDFERAVGEAGLAHRVFLVGPIYGEEKAQALTDAACFCLPSRQEGFSVAITEALASSCPVVITTGCHFPEVAEAGAGYVTALDAEEVGEALGRVLSDPGTAKTMGQAGRELVLGRFVWPVVARRIVELFDARRAH